MDTTNVNRFEVIDHRKDAPEFGRSMVIWEDSLDLNISFQDEGRTLKVFLTDKKED